MAPRDVASVGPQRNMHGMLESCHALGSVSEAHINAKVACKALSTDDKLNLILCNIVSV